MGVAFSTGFQGLVILAWGYLLAKIAQQGGIWRYPPKVSMTIASGQEAPGIFLCEFPFRKSENLFAAQS